MYDSGEHKRKPRNKGSVNVEFVFVFFSIVVPTDTQPR